MIQLGRSFHKIGPVTVVALVPVSVLVRGTYKSSSCLVVPPVCSLTVENYMNQFGYSPFKALYIVMHFSKTNLSLIVIHCSSFMIGVTWSYLLAPSVATLDAKVCIFLPYKEELYL